MNQQRKLSRHNSRQSSIGETASVCSTKSGRSTGSGSDYNLSNQTLTTSHHNQHLSGTSSRKSNGVSKNQDSGDSVAANILNVAEMLLHGVKDNEILEIWLRSINCEEFVPNFTDAGYDMPTISRITPQDLTAIGIPEPSKRLKILSEIKKLNLQDGLPNFRPASLSHWLSLIRLDSFYLKSLCDQNIDTIEKMCQLTWEDFEELGIVKLGHQKRLQLAIERLKSIEDDTKNSSSKPISEPIYDTNPSQILVVASAENHCMNGPIINKQSSNNELPSTCSGSIHSVHSANSVSHYQPTYEYSMGDSQQTMLASPVSNTNSQTPPSQLYSQHSAPIIYQQPSQLMQNFQQHAQHQQQFRQSIGGWPSQHLNGALMQNNNHNNGSGMMGLSSQQATQSSGQLPFSFLANLPKHQQQLLQQSSIYATLGRQPGKVKQPPPPVPIRTNSLKTNSLTDEINAPRQHPQHQTLQQPHHLPQQHLQQQQIVGSSIAFKQYVNGLPTITPNCNATTGKDDDFPPPPSPLSLNDSDESEAISLNSNNINSNNTSNSNTNSNASSNTSSNTSSNPNGNFTDIQHGLMTFRVGI